MFENKKEIYAYSLRIVGGKEVPEKIVEEKLQKKFPENSEDEILEIIEILKREKFIDDERFIENFIHWRKNNMPRGKRMICNELIRKKINISLAQEKCEQLISYDDEYKMCISLAKYKISSYKNIDDEYKKKEKLFRFLASKQFSFSLINDVYNNIDLKNL